MGPEGRTKRAALANQLADPCGVPRAGGAGLSCPAALVHPAHGVSRQRCCTPRPHGGSISATTRPHPASHDSWRISRGRCPGPRIPHRTRRWTLPRGPAGFHAASSVGWIRPASTTRAVAATIRPANSAVVSRLVSLSNFSTTVRVSSSSMPASGTASERDSPAKRIKIRSPGRAAATAAPVPAGTRTTVGPTASSGCSAPGANRAARSRCRSRTAS